MVQLINDDYEEFISLGTGLRGEEERLIRLGKPLGQLGEEIEGVRGMLLEQQIIVQEKLDKRAELREEKVCRPKGLSGRTQVRMKGLMTGFTGSTTAPIRRFG